MATKKSDEKTEKGFEAKDWKADAGKSKAKASARETEIERLQGEIARLEQEGNQPAKLEELRSLIDKAKAQSDAAYDADAAKK
jgi:hypothetical protein